MATHKNTIAERANKPEECIILPSFIVEGEQCLLGVIQKLRHPSEMQHSGLSHW